MNPVSPSECGTSLDPVAAPAPCGDSQATLDSASGRPVQRTSPPGQLFGRYVLMSELGHGGMGRVWKAWDTEMSRVVALKQILSEGDDAKRVERFMREARLAGKLRHPRIVAVHDVGVHEGQHFFTSDYIAGRSLDRVIDEGGAGGTPLRQAATWMKGVAEALAFAHEQGVVHRDVKPSNIIIGEDDRPYVMDFGLAREVETGRGLTVSGELLGTPAYMSPEQAGGMSREVGPASDQFSLGATFYELLTGRRAFDAPEIRDILNAVVEDDPAPPSTMNPRVHRDLEVICLKAMEKDPSRRYASMRELSEDLGRWLDGESIHAHPVAGWERLWRKGLKHWRVSAALLAATVVAIALGAYAVIAHFRHVREIDEERVRTKAALREKEQALAMVRKSERVSEVLGRWARMWRATQALEEVSCADSLSVEEKRRRVEGLWVPVKEFMDAFPEGDDGHWTMRAFAGWARRLAGYAEEGDAWMMEAGKRDPDVPYGPLLCAMVRFASYTELQKLPPIVMGQHVEFGPPPAEMEEMGSLRADMSALLDRAASATIWGKGEAEAYRGALASVRAMQSGEYEKAEVGLTEAIDELALRSMRQTLVLARAKVRYVRAEFATALEDIQEVSTRRPRTAAVWIISGLIRCGAGIDKASRGDDPREAYRKSVADYGAAISCDADLAEAYTDRAMVCQDLGDAEAARGADPTECYRKAIADCSEALTRAPGMVDAICNRGMARVGLATWASAHGDDPGEKYKEAIADFDRALTLAPDYAEVCNDRGVAFLSLGDAQAARGEDPRESYARAVADFGRTLALDARHARACNNCGTAYVHLAGWQGGHGLDPRDTYQKAVEEFGEALSRDPELARALNNRGAALSGLGAWEEGHGTDGRSHMEGAIADYDRALARNPNDEFTRHNRGGAWRSLGEALAMRGEDPRACYRKAIADEDAAIAQNPNDARRYCNRGLARDGIGKWLDAHGKDPRKDYRQAAADYAEALARNPSCVEAYDGRGCECVCLGRAEAARGGDPMGSFEKAMADFDAALARDPRWWPVYRNKGFLLECQERPAQAVECYEKALSIVGEGEPSLRVAMARARFDAARRCSRASVGRDSSKSDPRPVAGPEAARLRAEAFRQLGQWVSSGFADGKRLSEDPDLAPLHDDPRWAELLHRLNR